MAKGRPTRNKKRQREDGYSYSSSEEQHCSSKKRQKKGKNKAISWTEEEDKLLKKIVAKSDASGRSNDNIRWISIASKMKGRTGKQCRERWHNHLRPGLKKGPWTNKEVALMVKFQSEIGNQWSKIASKMPGRSDNDIKNKWNAIMRNYVRRPKGGSGGNTQKKREKSASIRSLAKRKGRNSGSRNRINHFGKRENDDEYEYGSTRSTSEESDSDDELTGRQVEDDNEAEAVQSESQREWGERLKEYRWRLEQEKKIELFRRGRMDCGLDCEEVQRLKLMGLGLGVKQLRQAMFGTPSATGGTTGST
mmetsp:Transcript_22578/g.49010  ORF Transcript_22578/g.49010 Transcript_22578/m.49010 type:complete len:307 (-) Transcript_22578:65-985(-)